MPDIVLPGARPLATIGNEDMPVNVDLKIYQGDYKIYYFELLDANGLVLDISNQTAKAQFKLDYKDSSPVTLNTAIENNKIKMELTSPQSSSLVEVAYIYDIQLTDPYGKVRTYITGDITIVPQVTT